MSTNSVGLKWLLRALCCPPKDGRYWDIRLVDLRVLLVLSARKVTPFLGVRSHIRVQSVRRV